MSLHQPFVSRLDPMLCGARVEIAPGQQLRVHVDPQTACVIERVDIDSRIPVDVLELFVYEATPRRTSLLSGGGPVSSHLFPHAVPRLSVPKGGGIGLLLESSHREPLRVAIAVEGYRAPLEQPRSTMQGFPVTAVQPGDVRHVVEIIAPELIASSLVMWASAPGVVVEKLELGDDAVFEGDVPTEVFTRGQSFTPRWLNKGTPCRLVLRNPTLTSVRIAAAISSKEP